MIILLLVGAVALGGYALINKANGGNGFSLTPPTPGSANRITTANTSAAVTYGTPGSVTLGGQPSPSGWSPNQAPGQAIALSGVGLGAVSAIGSSSLGAGSAGAFGATALGGAVPFIGIGIAAAGIILGAIAKHHATAVALEAKDLNEAEPHAIQGFVLVVQAVIAGEIRDLGGANTYLNQVLADYYTSVRGIMKGKWPCQGSPSEFIDTSIGVVGDPVGDGKCGHSLCGRDIQLKEWHIGHPDPCNGPCVVGHILDGFRLMAVQTCTNILQGKHGIMVFKSIPAHAGAVGFPETRLVY